MKTKIQEKLEWALLLESLAAYCQTEEGKRRAQEKGPGLDRIEVLKRWAEIEPLLGLIRLELYPEIGGLVPIYSILKSLSIGQVLEHEQFKSILQLLDTTQKVADFVRSHASTCATLSTLSREIEPLPKLWKAISKAIDEEGLVRDDATPELSKIRAQKRSLRKRIEESLSGISQGSEFAKYIQDDFFTVREDRYVIPVKLDGRGRVPGTIIDASSSGQTLFIEPVSIRNHNQTLKELELSERLEVFRILRELSQSLARESHTIKKNYEEIVSFDLMYAEAKLAYILDGRPIPIRETPVLKLIDARHPQLKLEGGRVVANNIELKEGQNSLIISGPNAGGKTVVLKTVGIIHLMVSAGLMPPVGEGSEIFLFENMYIEMGDTQDLKAHLSTFSGHLLGIKPILQKASQKDIVFLDELCVGTEPQTGAALAQSILEELARRGVWVISTTHYDSLKVLALNNNSFRSGAMGFSKNYQATYKLNVDLPGLSFGIEVAEQVGIPREIVKRAREIHGSEASAFEDAISKLLTQAQEYETKLDAVEVKARKAEEEKARWTHEVEVLKQKRHDLAEKVIEQYEEEFKELRRKFEDEFKKLKQSKDLPADKKEVEETLEEFKEGLGRLRDTHVQRPKEPGEPVVFERLNEGDYVYVSRFRKKGRILRLGKHKGENIEVEVGSLKFHVKVQELRTLPPEGKKPLHLQPRPKKETVSIKGDKTAERLLVIPSATNSLNLRGLTVDEALDKTWKFMDAAVMRGEYAVILIHGHGTHTLKQAIRKSLESESPYDIDFYSGSPSEGGDGVTVVYFRRD